MVGASTIGGEPVRHPLKRTQGLLIPESSDFSRGEYVKDLVNADVALFFISGYDLVHNRENILQDNMNPKQWANGLPITCYQQTTSLRTLQNQWTSL